MNCVLKFGNILRNILRIQLNFEYTLKFRSKILQEIAANFLEYSLENHGNIRDFLGICEAVFSSSSLMCKIGNTLIT